MSACSCVHSLASRYTIYSNPQHIHRGQGPDLLPVQGFHILAGWSWWSIGPNVAGFMVPCPLHVEFAVGHPGNQSSQKLFDIPDMSESSCLPVWLWLVHWWVILMKKYWKSSYPFLPWAFLKSFCGPQVRGWCGMMYFSICPGNLRAPEFMKSLGVFDQRSLRQPLWIFQWYDLGRLLWTSLPRPSRCWALTRSGEFLLHHFVGSQVISCNFM